MKQLIFIRHAKSSWEDRSLPDRDRPLNARGRRDAPQMAAYLKEKVEKVDLICPSIAQRTQETARHFQRVFGIPELHFVPTETLYLAGMEAYLHQIWSIEEEVEVAMFFGHNPTMTDIAHHIRPGLTTNVPTCGILHVDVDVEYWADFDFDKSLLRGYYYPKMLAGA